MIKPETGNCGWVSLGFVLGFPPLREPLVPQGMRRMRMRPRTIVYARSALVIFFHVVLEPNSVPSQGELDICHGMTRLATLHITGCVVCEVEFSMWPVRKASPTELAPTVPNLRFRHWKTHSFPFQFSSA